MPAWIYAFDTSEPPVESAAAAARWKRAGLLEMTRLGLPVRPASPSTAACTWFFDHDGSWPDGLGEQLEQALTSLKASTGKVFGGAERPLLVSVRSGAPVSMPGMMDTVLNLGLNFDTVAALAEMSGNARFAWDSYRRFVQMFGDVVLGIHYTQFSRAVVPSWATLRDDLTVEEPRRSPSPSSAWSHGTGMGSRKTRVSSCGWPSGPSSAATTATVRATTARPTASATTPAPP